MSVSFTKLTFVDGSTAVPLNAANLNALENAVNTLCVGGTGSGVAANTVTTAATTTSGTCYPVFGLSASGELQMYSSTGLTYVPSTGTLTATLFSGNATGLAAGLVANITTTYGGLYLSAAKGTYAGLTLAGAPKTSFMDDGTNRGIYCERDGKWMIISSDTANVSCGYNFSAPSISNAVWNDIADFLEVEPEAAEIEYGRVYVYDDKTRRHRVAKKYAERGILGIASDTLGIGVGKKPEGTPQLPVAIGGFVLAYTKKVYRTGTPLTSSKNGVLVKARLLTRIAHPERIVGTFYKAEPAEIWNAKIAVKGRNWVEVK